MWSKLKCEQLIGLSNPLLYPNVFTDPLSVWLYSSNPIFKKKLYINFPCSKTKQSADRIVFIDPFQGGIIFYL